MAQTSHAEVLSDNLAIVIPAFKGEFLAKTLGCLVRQTDQRFNLYICDDASPADIQGIARSTLGARSYVYKRFEENLGSVSLAQQWNRCVSVSSEPWVWLFSDDDLMDDNCVGAIHKFLETDGDSTDVLRFGVWMADEEGQVTGPLTVDSDPESWLEFAYGHFMGWRGTLMQNIVFRRSAFEKAGAFLDLPLCWGTEFAAVIALGRDRAIRRIPGASVYWRNSPKHISSDHSMQTRTKKLRAACLFLRWFREQLNTPRQELFTNDVDAFRRAMDLFLTREIMNQGSLPAIANWDLLSRTRAEVCNGSALSLVKYVALAAVNDGFSGLGKCAKALARS